MCAGVWACVQGFEHIQTCSVSTAGLAVDRACLIQWIVESHDKFIIKPLLTEVGLACQTSWLWAGENHYIRTTCHCIIVLLHCNNVHLLSENFRFWNWQNKFKFLSVKFKCCLGFCRGPRVLFTLCQIMLLDSTK